jgi:site-specific DNA-methyltransferase (adenine-specific)
MEYLIRTYTNEGETVLDFTMGSGTTGVACINTAQLYWHRIEEVILRYHQTE